MRNKFYKLIQIVALAFVPLAMLAQVSNGQRSAIVSESTIGVVFNDNAMLAPIAYNVTGGGSFCAGDAGVVVGLDNSEVGVTYILLKNAVAQVPTIAGTGLPISFGLQQAGLYTVKGGLTGDTTLMTGSALVTANPLPVPSLSGPNSVCSGVAGNVYTTEAGKSNYVWVVSAGGTITSGGTATSNTVTVTWTSAGSRSVQVNYQNSLGCDAATATQYPVNVNTTPAAPSAITGLIFPCEATVQSYSVTMVPGVTYTWTLPFGFSLISGQGTNTISVMTGGASGDLSVLSSNGCGIGGVTNQYISVNPLPGNSGPIAGTPSPCVGNTLTYSVTNVAGSTYTWAVPTGWNILSGQGTNLITASVTSAGGNISVVPSNACGNADTTFKAVSPITIPAAPAAITGATDTCQNSSGLIYSVVSSIGVTYTWILPNGWTITSGQGTSSIVASSGTTGGVITVYPSNSCGTGVSATLAVTLNPEPLQPASLTGPTVACSGSELTYAVPATAGETYQWSFPVGWVVVSGQGTDSVVVVAGYTGGDISCTPINNCGAGVPATLAVVVHFVIADAGVDQSIAAGTSTLLSGSAASGSGNYGWSWEPASLLLNPTVQNPQTVDLIATTDYILTVADITTGCNDIDTVSVVVQYEPMSLVALATPDTICPGDEVQLSVEVTGGTGNYTYVWTSNPPGFSSILADPLVNPLVSTDYTVVVNDGFNVAYQIVPVTMYEQVGLPQQPSGPDSVNINNNPSSVYSIEPVPNAVSYLWEIMPSMIGTLSANGNEVTVAWQAIGNAFLVVTAVGGCDFAMSDVKIIKVDNTIGLNESLASMIELYPNPVTDVAAIHFSSLKVLKIELVNITGSVVLSKTMSDVSGRIDIYVGNQPSGVYQLRLLTNKGVVVKRLMKI